MEARTIFSNARVFDGERQLPAPMNVVVEGHRIREVAEAPVETHPADRVIDAREHTLMPGLIQCHFHAGFGPAPNAAPPMVGLDASLTYFGALGVRNMSIALDCGVTSVIGSSNPGGLDVALKEAGILGVAEVPRIIPCTREFIASGDYADGTNRAWYMGLAEHGSMRRVDGEDAMRQACREELGRGAEVVKLSIAKGHGSTPTVDHSYYTRAEIDAAVEVANVHGGFVRAHCPSRTGIAMCAAAGVRIIDHADQVDEETMAAVLEAGAFITPSLLWTARLLELADSWDHDAAPFPIGVGLPMTKETVLGHIDGIRREFEYSLAMLPRMAEAGVKLLVGDDFGYGLMPHGDYVSEFEVYSKRVGLPPATVLGWATRNGAEAMGRGDDLGSVAVGRLADLILVDGDPTEDLGVLREGIRLVMRDGEIVRDSLPR